MEKKKNRKRNRLIVMAVLTIAFVFGLSSCMGAAVAGFGSYEMEYKPEESFAVINIAGTIQSAPTSPLDGYSYNHDVLMNYVDELISDETNHGILLRVNSGGGTVFHSDEMYLKLMEYKEVTGRPVHAYFEQTAASGAYYISCAADYISANKNCTTGSIGVIISYVDMSGLYEKVGLKEIIISSGDNKGMGSSGTPLTDEQYAIYQSHVDESYREFTRIVAQARNMDIQTVRTLADGRIYTASQAVENGLADSIGNWDDAINEMEKLTGVESYEKVFYTDASWLDYLLYGISDIVPKSDVQALGEMTSSELSGVPLYLWKN